MRTVLCAEGLYEPTSALTAYLDHYPATATDPVRLIFGARRTPIPDAVTSNPNVQLAGMMPGRGLRGRDLEYLRGGYSDICEWLQTGRLRIDAVVAVAGRDAAGGFSLGVVNGYLQLALNAAGTLVFEELHAMPMIQGAATSRRADLTIDAPTPGEFVPLAQEPDALTTAIADRVAEHCALAEVLSLGVGKVAAALAARMESESPLQVVAGAVDDGIRRLVERGLVAERMPIATMSIVGSPATVSWAASDPRVRLFPSDVIHNSRWLSTMDGFTSILGALQVDRQGNVNAESVGGRLVSGIGGARDFAEGAHASRGGRCIVCLPSRSPDGGSNLVDALEHITIPTQLVDVVVTEHGSAFTAQELPTIFN